MAKKSRLQRVIRAYFRLPDWARPPIACGIVVLAIMIPRVLWALPALFTGKGSLGELCLALGAATGAAVVGGLIHGLTRPRLRKLGRAGDYLSGIAILYGYLGSLALASPYVFESSAIPEDAKGRWIGIALMTVLGLAAGQFWFAGPDGIDRLREQRSQPQLRRLQSEQGDRTATLVSGWVRPETLAALLERVAATLGGTLARDEAARIVAVLAVLPGDDDEGLDWPLEIPRPIGAHFVAGEGLVNVDVLLEGDDERGTAAVRAAFAAHTVDPLAA
jgi:hypothetical protein